MNLAFPLISDQNSLVSIHFHIYFHFLEKGNRNDRKLKLKTPNRYTYFNAGYIYIAHLYAYIMARFAIPVVEQTKDCDGMRGVLAGLVNDESSYGLFDSAWYRNDTCKQFMPPTTTTSTTTTTTVCFK